MKVDKKSWKKGYEAGLRQQESQPENTEVLSWYAGLLEGQAAAKIKIKIKESIKKNEKK